MEPIMSTHFPVPPGTQTVQVRIIDTTVRMDKLPVEFVMEPPMEGMPYMPPMPAWSFLIEHPSGQKLLFDLGVPKDWRLFSPFVVGRLEASGWEINVEEEVIDILERNGVAAGDISGIIWSHWHWDHLGDPSRFPPSTELIVGPGFKDNFLPGYPANPNSAVRESDFAGRSLNEINFTNSPQTGQFRAFDFFGDGSFYLLDTPGHAIGHLSGLARTTTNPDTFIFMGGDLCHHSGEIRPSKHMHLPYDIPAAIQSRILPCPGTEAYEQLLVSRGSSVDEPFFRPAAMIGVEIGETVRTIVNAQEADADSNVWFVFAHDPSLIGVVDFFPLRADEWMEKGWRKKTLWSFLRDFDAAVYAKMQM